MTDRTDRREGARAAGTDAQRAALEHFAARKATKHATAVISAMRDALMIVDELGVITDTNDALCAMTGFGRHQLIGVRAYPFWSPEDRAANAAAVAQAIRTADTGAAQAELTLTARSGARLRVAASIAALRDCDDEPMGYAATLRHIADEARQDPAAAEPDDDGLMGALAVAIEEPSIDIAFARIAARAATAVSCDAAVIVRIEDGNATRVGRWSAEGSADLSDAIAPNSVHEAFAAGGVRVDGGPDHTFITVIGVPIRLAGRPWGMLYTGRLTGGDPLPAEAPSALARFVATATLALIAIDARRPSEREGARDPLTGLDDRPSFDERLVSELSRARRYGRDLSLVVLEIDDLVEIERVLDTDGRDRVIVVTAGIMRRLVRTGDVLARTRAGGFAWLLPETDARAAIGAAERAQALVATIGLPDDTFVTMSCGVADARDADHDAGEMFRQAELALHQAGETGGGVIGRFESERPRVSTSRFGADGRRQTLASLRLAERVMDTTGGQRARASEIVADLAERTALHLGWPTDDARLLHEATLVRDIGMLGIPEEIRSKSRGLSGSERSELEGHAEIGAQLVAQVLREEQVAWIRHHHERYDGAGYPGGIAGRDIPEGARIIAAADAWVELSSEMRGRASLDELIEQVQAETGWQFCPMAATALIDVLLDRPSTIDTPAGATTSSRELELILAAPSG